MIMNLHTHTRHSYDGAPESVADRIAAAKALGLKFMAVTDHVEVNRYFPASYYGAEPSEQFTYHFSDTFAQSVAETEREQDRCRDLMLLCGVELGQITQAPEIAQALYADPRLDLVIASVHELGGMPDFYYLDYSKLDIPALITQYFDEVLATAKTDCYDILAHITYPLRYIPCRGSYDITPHLPVIDEIFKVLIEKGKALELNGSGLRKTPQYTDPDPALLRRYRELGGKFLTISTDAHATEFLGYRMDELEQMARDAGFSYLTYFVKHEPQLVPLG